MTDSVSEPPTSVATTHRSDDALLECDQRFTEEQSRREIGENQHDSDDDDSGDTESLLSSYDGLTDPSAALKSARDAEDEKAMPLPNNLDLFDPEYQQKLEQITPNRWASNRETRRGLAVKEQKTEVSSAAASSSGVESPSEQYICESDSSLTSIPPPTMKMCSVRNEMVDIQDNPVMQSSSSMSLSDEDEIKEPMDPIPSESKTGREFGESDEDSEDEDGDDGYQTDRSSDFEPKLEDKRKREKSVELREGDEPTMEKAIQEQRDQMDDSQFIIQMLSEQLEIERAKNMDLREKLEILEPKPFEESPTAGKEEWVGSDHTGSVANELADELLEKQAENNRLKRKLSELLEVREQWEILKCEKEEYLIKIEDQKKENDGLQQQNGRFQLAIESLKKEVSKTKDIRNSHEDLTNKLKNCKSQLIERENEIIQLKKDNHDFKEEVKGLLKRMEEKNEEIEKCHERLKERNEEVKSKQKQIDEMESTIESLRLKCSAAESKRDDSKIVAAYKEDISRLKTELGKVMAERDVAVETHSSLSQICSYFSDENRDLKEKIKNRDSEIDRLNGISPLKDTLIVKTVDDEKSVDVTDCESGRKRETHRRKDSDIAREERKDREIEQLRQKVEFLERSNKEVKTFETAIINRAVEMGLKGWNRSIEVDSLSGNPMFLEKVVSFITSDDPINILHAQYLFYNRRNVRPNAYYTTIVE